jgi:diaminopimelate epimerase
MTTLIQFTKMHGLGNDFVVFDAINQSIHLTTTTIQTMADRHFGIGCDQVLLVEKPQSNTADFTYRIFNADGSEVSQCGNGARCFARFVHYKKLSQKNTLIVDTHAGQLTLITNPDDTFTVNMGIPQFAPSLIPLTIDKQANTYSADIDGSTIHFSALSLGNPHAVIQVNDIDKAPVSNLGRALESHSIFPERVNVGFMQIIDNHTIALRVYERGSGETLACGSGACAAAITGILQGDLQQPVTVNLRGGALSIAWQGINQPVLMSGTADVVFDGQILL